MKPLLGISLQADRSFLALNRELIEDHAEIYEVAPETTWRSGCEPGPAWSAFRQIREHSGRPMIAHSLAFSLGSAVPPTRRAQWLHAMHRDHEVFDYLWWSDHLGYTDAGEQHTALPLPLPFSEEAVTACGAALTAMAAVIPQVAVENAANLVTLGDPCDAPRMWAELCAREPRPALVLDLHNVFVECTNFGIAREDYLAPTPWESVLEIHLSGGSQSEPGLLRSGRTFRLDSHNGAVPNEVWTLFEQVLPRCPNLRAVIVEWVADDMTAAAATQYQQDVRRAKEMMC